MAYNGGALYNYTEQYAGEYRGKSSSPFVKKSWIDPVTTDPARERFDFIKSNHTPSLHLNYIEKR